MITDGVAARVLTHLSTLHRQLGQAAMVRQVLAEMATDMKTALQAESCALLLRGATGEDLAFHAVSDLSPETEERLQEVRVPITRGIGGA